MATYAIGDVQGCFDELQDLLALVGFNATRDRLWLVGDLVNRGPKSAEVLRFLMSLGDAARVVLGNHDFFLLRVAEGFGRAHPGDTLHQVTQQPDAPALLRWLRHQPLVVAEDEYLMVHAGVLPQWSREAILEHAAHIEAQLGGPHWRDFLRDVFGNEPAGWSDALTGIERARVIVNAFCRLRFCTPEGAMEFAEKRSSEHAPKGMLAWTHHPNRVTHNTTLVTGHWSSEGLRLLPKVLMLDSGCLWGGSLTAIRLEDRRVFQVPSRQPLQLTPAD